jgi:D-alanyl-D-alanine carboxypeptidase/D-alanyl-D-alanine-endopeptidase (penicillin-binding protein 4)
MNVYSNNKIAEILAKKIGGGQKVAEITAELAKVSPREIQLINGSGLGVDNRISPRASCKMLMALSQQLEGKNISIADLFPVSNFGRQGTIEDRNIPSGLAVKTGTLATVSALAGVFPTQQRGNVCFAIINYGNNIEKMRQKQDILLQNLAQHWQIESLKPLSENSSYFGDPERNLI